MIWRAQLVKSSAAHSQNMELERQKPWAMAYDPSLNKWESLPDPSSYPIKVNSIFSAAGEFPNPCIVVGSPGNGLQIYQVNAKKWKKREFKICPIFGGDKFCLLWVSVLPHKRVKISEFKDDCISLLHCTKLREGADEVGFLQNMFSCVPGSSSQICFLVILGFGIHHLSCPMHKLHKKAIPFIKNSAAQAIAEEHLPPSDSSIISPQSS
ncbi:unnamed protein product [Camellia sinensis]